MKAALLKTRERLLNIGVHKGMSPAGISSLRTYNAVVLFYLFGLVISLSTNLITLSWTNYDWITYPCGFGVILLSLLLNHFRRPYFSKLVFVVGHALTLFLLTIVCGNLFFGALFSLILLSITIGFFVSERDVFFISIFILGLSVLSFFVVADTEYDFDNNAYIPIERAIVYAIGFLGFYLCLIYYKKISLGYFKKNRELIQKLNERNEELQKSYENLERFSYLIAHDIKAPLRSMNSFAKLMEKDVKRGKLDNLEEYSDFVVNSGNRLSKMVDEVLFFSRISNDQEIEHHEINTNDMVELIKYELTNRENNWKISHDKLHSIQGNKTKISVLFQNLIENGLKYNRSDNPSVHISSKEESNFTEFEIKDNGIGIPVEKRDEIFKLFTRLHSEREFEGTGIGLANCKKIVENHLKGTISVLDNEPQGSIMRIRIPKLN